MDHDFAAEVAVVTAGEGTFGDEDFFFDAAAGVLDGGGDEDSFLPVMEDAEVGGGVGGGGKSGEPILQFSAEGLAEVVFEADVGHVEFGGAFSADGDPGAVGE